MTVKILGLLAFGLAVSMAANADTETLYYTGSDVTPVTSNGPLSVSGNIYGYLTLDAPLAANLSAAAVNPSVFSFNGGDPLSNLNSSAQNLFLFSTDASSNITAWIFALTGTTSSGNTFSEGSAFYPTDGTSPASSQDVMELDYSTQDNPNCCTSIGVATTPGTWTVASVAAPEIDPTSAVGGLMLLLGSLAVIRGRTKAVQALRAR
ncbi:MAG TPA: hypothetical protein VGO37_06210 [Steroidobacteraceae bacterium]|nr:hypothetical protein [Steroidobacteraceae bacterium]